MRMHSSPVRTIAQRTFLRPTSSTRHVRHSYRVCSETSYSACSNCGNSIRRYCGSGCISSRSWSVQTFETQMRRQSPLRRSFSSNKSSSKNSEEVLPPDSPLYDPRTNEPAGLRLVLDGLKRMEEQVTNIENDLDSVKNIVKRIRESNGNTEKRLDKIENFADTMQQDLYLTMDMMRSLTDVLSETKTPEGPNLK